MADRDGGGEQASRLNPASPDQRTTVCVAGGGPAGVMLGLLLARAGIDVTVLEKHADFLRDFRGDTIHPTTLDLLDDLGILPELADVPHTTVTALDAVINGVRFRSADFTRVGRSGQLWFMPQWDLLNTLVESASRYGNFTLRTNTRANGVIVRDGRVTGVRVEADSRTSMIEADLVVAADGRNSALRVSADLALQETGVAVDLLWFRVVRPARNPPDTIAYIGTDAVITIPRTDYYQCALFIAKGADAAIRAAGIEAFHRRIACAVPFLEPTADSVETWDDVKLLDVRIARAPRWHRPGLLLIGDAAHPMSPAFGVGINYAVQDAVAAARTLVAAPDIAAMTDSELHAIQRRRQWPVTMMQRVQRGVHRTIGRPHDRGVFPPAPVLRRTTPVTSRLIRRLTGRLVGAGFRPETLDF